MNKLLSTYQMNYKVLEYVCISDDCVAYVHDRHFGFECVREAPVKECTNDNALLLTIVIEFFGGLACTPLEVKCVVTMMRDSARSSSVLNI